MSNKEKVSKADEIWNKIKDAQINLYALSGQTVGTHVERLPITDEMVHLKLKSQAVYPLLEEVISSVKLSSGESLELSRTKDYIVIKPFINTENVDLASLMKK